MTVRSWKARKTLTEALRGFNPPRREQGELPNPHIAKYPPFLLSRFCPRRADRHVKVGWSKTSENFSEVVLDNSSKNLGHIPRTYTCRQSCPRYMS
jgi:hypothetical protein